MASNFISALGSVIVPALASSVVSVYSKGDVSVYKQLNPTGAWMLVGTSTNTEAQYAISGATNVRIDVGSQDALYALGSAAVILEKKGLRTQTASTPLIATGFITAAAMLGGLVSSTTAAAVVGTLPTGAVLEAAVLNMQPGESFDWSVVNSGPNSFTVTAAAGHTVSGAGAVATNTSGMFRTRKIIASAYDTCRVA